MRKRKILVCGATGFIGRNIADHLAQRDDTEVYGIYFRSLPLTNPAITMVHADLRKEEDVYIAVKGMDEIIQAAAITSGAKDIVTNPQIHVTDNAIMNSLIAKAAHEHKVPHMTFFSCGIMYPQIERPLKETDFDANVEMHQNYFGAGWTKVYIEKVCEFFSRLGNTRHTVIRHSNCYGPYDKFDLERSHVFGATITKVLTTHDGKIIVWGNGEEEKDLLYVTDLVNFVELAMVRQTKPFGLYNVGYGRSISIRNLVEKIVSCSEKNIEICYNTTKPTIKTKMCFDTTRAREEIGWAPKVSLEEGIQKTIQWYRKNMLINNLSESCF